MNQSVFALSCFCLAVLLCAGGCSSPVESHSRQYLTALVIRDIERRELEEWKAMVDAANGIISQASVGIKLTNLELKNMDEAKSTQEGKRATLRDTIKSLEQTKHDTTVKRDALLPELDRRKQRLASAQESVDSFRN